MSLDRRIFLTGLGATLVLAGCRGPATLTVSAQAAPGANPGADGADRPLTVFLLQMSGTGAFDNADFFSLQDPATALGPELIKADQIVLAPGASAQTVLTMQPGTTVVGVAAAFRDPAGKQFRAKTPAPGGNAGVIIAVGPSGLQLQDA
ncbi:MAG: type VI secretion system lipoprotein TssJ [Pseudomonadota bacterium]